MEMEASFPRSRRKPIDPTKCRGSCDACTKSKVRCSKEQPSCQRCINQDVVCHYSPALRYRKRSSDSTPTEPRTPGTPCRDRSSPISASGLDNALISERDREKSPIETSPVTGIFSTQPAASPDRTFSIGQTLPEYGDHNSPNWNLDMLASGIPAQQYEMDQSSKSTQQHWIEPPLFPSPDDQMFDCENDLQSYLNIMNPDTTVLSLSSYSCLTASTGNVSGHTQGCTNVAFSTLQLLQASIPSCTLVPLSSKPAPSPSVDWVLKNNKIALCHVLDILDCPCSLNQHFALLLTLMSSKILAWYSAILQNDSNSRPSTSEPSPSFPEKVTHLPITIGAYRLSGEDHSKMIAQLVLTELKKVGWAVDRFHKRYCQGGGKMDLVVTLESFLRASLRSTLALAAERLKDQ
ncbi:hypothetical protein MMC07_009295 [Pseudocyphellaria aurata]|nr:hypothetical protein [Pseudocyphellaria aurata]